MEKVDIRKPRLYTLFFGPRKYAERHWEWYMALEEEQRLWKNASTSIFVLVVSALAMGMTMQGLLAVALRGDYVLVAVELLAVAINVFVFVYVYRGFKSFLRSIFNLYMRMGKLNSEMYYKLNPKKAPKKAEDVKS